MRTLAAQRGHTELPGRWKDGVGNVQRRPKNCNTLHAPLPYAPPWSNAPLPHTPATHSARPSLQLPKRTRPRTWLQALCLPPPHHKARQALYRAPPQWLGCRGQAPLLLRPQATQPAPPLHPLLLPPQPPLLLLLLLPALTHSMRGMRAATAATAAPCPRQLPRRLLRQLLPWRAPALFWPLPCRQAWGSSPRLKRWDCSPRRCCPQTRQAKQVGWVRGGDKWQRGR